MSLFSISERPIGRLTLLLSVLLVTLCATSVGATVMRYVDLARLVELSDVIVQGHVVSQSTHVDAETEKLWTTTTVRVDTAFLGQPGRTVAFEQWGGEKDGVRAAIPGDATFREDEEVLVFLVDGTGEFAGARYLAALSQSKFTVDRTGRKPVVERDFTNVAILDPDSGVLAERSSKPIALENFIPELESLIAGIKGGQR